MSSTRPPLQAKYELLGEHVRTSTAKRTVAVLVLIFAIVGIAIITVYLSLNGIQAVGNSGFLHPVDNQIDGRSNIKDEHEGYLKTGHGNNANNVHPLNGPGYDPENNHEMSGTHKKRLELYGFAFLEMKKLNASQLESINVPNVAESKTENTHGTESNTENAHVTESKTETAQEMVNHMLVCYYVFPTGDLTPKAIDPKLCTHIIIASMSVVNKTLSVLQLEESKVVQEVVALKEHNLALKVMICVGGYSVPGGYNDMVSTYETRKQFIKDVLSLASNYSLDGIDLDWEFPAWLGAASEREKFTFLLKEMREEIDKMDSKLLLSVAVAAPKNVIDVSYEVPKMAQYVDFINLMAYDYHFYIPYLPVTGPNAPLYSRHDEEGYIKTLNTNWSANYWAANGMPKNKIVVGIPTYGHSFKLVNPDNHGWSAPAEGFGSLGSGGFVTYRQVCTFLAEPGTSSQFDLYNKVPYAFHEQEWLSYDDDRSVSFKAEYIVNNDFAGAMVFSLNQDDYEGICTGKTFRLTRQIQIVLMDDQMFQIEMSLSIALGMQQM